MNVIIVSSSYAAKDSADISKSLNRCGIFCSINGDICDTTCYATDIVFPNNNSFIYDFI